MKKQTKFSAIVASLASLAIVATTLGASTFAWFTRGTTASASGFDFTAMAASGIQISTDANDWKSSISALDFNTSSGPQAGNRITLTDMEPISTIDSVTDGSFTFYNGTSGDGNFTLAEDTENYLMFDLYFLNQGAENLTLSLTDTSAVTDDLVNDKNTSLSTRVAFVIQGSSSDAGVVVGMNGGSSAYIWEPNSLTRSTSALAGAVNNAKYEYEGIATNNGGAPVSTSRSYLPAGAYSDTVTTTKDIAIGDSPIIGVIPGAQGGQITKITVFVWIEGQDVDCNNETSAGQVLISLGFDSGAAATQLEEKTAATVDALNGTTLLLEGNANFGGVVYNAYILQADVQGESTEFELNYRRYITTGTATHDGADVTSITLDSAVNSAETYQVVVTATYGGAIGSRTSSSVVAV